ncbi:hypothetical protein BJ912DRAFT_953978 [Pholiota molesta]|nr:hypothetical protein BJ912DRAFT_953978 [Pholiota molesta]
MEDFAAQEAEKAPRRQSAKAAVAAMADQLESSDSDDAYSGGMDAQAGSSTRKRRAGVARTYAKTAATRKRSATTKEDARVGSKLKKARSPSLPEAIAIMPAPPFPAASVPDCVSDAPPRPAIKKPTPATLPHLSKILLIKTPSEGNILPKDRGYLPRFSTPTFVSSYPNSSSAPKKKQKLDRDEIEKRWNIAVEEMKEDDEASKKNEDTDTDDFPEPTNMYEFLTAPVSKAISAPPKLDLSKDAAKASTTKIKGKRKRKDISETSADEHQVTYVNKKEERWDEVDDELDLPGELVLGRDGPNKDIDYWPAKLISYIPPTKPNQAGKYAVTWLDGTTGQIPRSWFYTMNEDEFSTCKLGKFDSAVVEVQNDNADEDEIQQDHDLARRSPSPTPLDIPPSPNDFIQLSIRQQFVYTKTVLKAIIDNTYLPSKQKHVRYMKGGKYRQSVVDDASLRGKMDPRDVEHLQIYIRAWCLRDEDRTGVPFASNLSSGEQSVIEVGAGAAPTNLDERREIQAEPSLDDVMNMEDRRFTSPLPTEACPSSPAPMPPSSLPPPEAELEREDSIASIPPSFDAALDDAGVPPLSPVATSIFTEPRTIDTDDDIVDLTIAEEEERQPPSLSSQYDGEDFKSLSALEKVDYCVNILLPEAVRQILLWRSGARTSIDLLSPAEEQALYEQGDTLLQERDWVNDVIRYRRAMEKALLGKKRASATSQRQNGHSRMGSTSRPRRSIVIPNYQE